jgi:hypothetical protein
MWIQTVLIGAAGAGAAVPAWVAVNWIGKPILAVEDQRREALRIAERYGFTSPLESDDCVRVARRALIDLATAIHAHGRTLTRPARLYCTLRRYDFESAGHAMRGLAQMAGDPRFHESTRANNLNWAYISLRAYGHLSAAEIQEVNDAVAAEMTGRDAAEAAN